MQYIRTFITSMEHNTGSFVISLDFELMWGVRDEVTKETYGEHIRGVHHVIPKLLSAFSNYSIHATFASVGFLFFQDKKELLANLPLQKPNYKDSNLSPYGPYIESEVGERYPEDPYHFGWHLLQEIRKTPGQEIGTHTFSHFYCLEPGQDIITFEQDLIYALRIANKRNIAIETIIFPRNQVQEQYLEVCRKHGIKSYRHNEESWIYLARESKHESLFRRSMRLLDTYINLTGHHCYTDYYMAKSLPFNIPSSRFLRPYSSSLRWLENLRLRRITRSMTHAAKHNLTYHLWWHPHNFGINQDENFKFLERILKHYQILQEQYSFTSLTMSEVAKRLYESKGR